MTEKRKDLQIAFKIGRMVAVTRPDARVTYTKRGTGYWVEPCEDPKAIEAGAQWQHAAIRAGWIDTNKYLPKSLQGKVFAREDVKWL